MKNLTCRGVTLTELIIAMSIVGVIMLGVISVDLAMRKQADNSQTGTYAMLYAQSVLQPILSTAFRAVGAGDDIGFWPNPWTNPFSGRSFCVRTSMTPVNWVCYTMTPNMSTSGDIYTCNRSTPNNCVSADNGYTQMGTVRSVQPVLNFSGGFGSSQRLFTATVSVDDPSTAVGYRSVTSSVSPPGHSL